MTLPNLSWESRPIEVANLLNPAFGAILLRDAVVAYQKVAATSMPYPVAFLILPLALHPATRHALPKTTGSLLHTWLEQHTALQTEAVPRVQRLVPYVREAVLFSVQHELLRIGTDGGLENIRTRIKNPFPANSDPAECRDAARFLGSWFGKVADPSFLLSLWGIRP